MSYPLTKVDQEEIYGSGRRARWTTGLVACLMVLVVMLGPGPAWRGVSEGVEHFRRELAERAWGFERAKVMRTGVR